MLPSGLKDLAEACAALGCLYLALAIVIVFRFKKSNAHRGASFEPVSILKPLYGDEPELAACLVSFCSQDYPAPVQIIFGLQDAKDPALAVARNIQAAFPRRAIEIKLDATSHGSNAKVSNLVNIAEGAKQDIFVIADSDICVRPNYLRNVVSELGRPGVGAVTLLYHGAATSPVWSKLSALAINAHFLPNVVAGMGLGLARPCFGSTIALRRETLDSIGGLKAFADRLADDYAIGEAVRSVGYKVSICSFSVAHVCHEESGWELLMHQIRWARTIKSIDLTGYIGSFVAHPFPFALIGLAAGSDDCFVLAGAAVACRLILCKAVELTFGLERQRYWLLPICDVLSFWVYIWSFFGDAVNWKSENYTVMPDGTLVNDRRGRS